MFQRFLLSALCVATAASAQAQKAGVPVLPTGPQLLHSKPVPSRGAARPASTTTVFKPRVMVSYEWDAQAGAWDKDNAQMATTTYNAQALPTQVVYADSADNVLTTRMTTTYDAQNRATQLLTETWDNGSWANAARLGVTYDSFGDVTNYKSEVWLGSQWMVMSDQRHTISRQAGTGLVQQIDTEVKTFPATTYTNTRREIRTITNGQYSEVRLMKWQNGAFVNDSRTHSLVWQDWANQVPASYEEQQWDQASATWTDDTRFTFTYTPTSSVELAQTKQGTAWVNQNRYTSTFDNFGNATGYLKETWTGSAWAKADEDKALLTYGPNNRVLREVWQELDVNANTFENNTRNNYSDFQSFIINSSRARSLEAAATLYPNPTLGTATFSLKGLRQQAPVQAEVLNGLGQVVRAFAVPVQQGRIEQEISLTAQPAGVYTLRLHTAEGVVARRVVKQ